MKAWTKTFLLGSLLMLGSGATTLLAQGDSSSDSPGGFAKIVEESEGVMIRVPVNARGEEHTDAAEIRVYDGAGVGDGADLREVWETSTDGTKQPMLDSDSSTDTDSSTSGHWGRYRSWGWQPSYYYGSYRPYYSYYGSYYSYYRPYSYYYSYPYYGYSGYRYYYYPRYWD